ncbi:ImmA/IrrE family metallo-endopeptidase [Patescibacteria group bacterium]
MMSLYAFFIWVYNLSMSSEQYKTSEKKALELLEKHKIKKPFVDVFYIVEKEGVDIRFVGMPEGYEMAAGFLDYDENNMATIYVNKDESAGRQLFTIAHELGHYALEHKSKDCEVLLRRPVPGDQKSKEEVEADVFAANLLVPEEMLLEVMRRYNISRYQESSLSKIFGVSQTMMKYRLNFLNIG